MTPTDAHDPSRDDDRTDNLVLLALGERAEPWVEEHVATCAACQAELAELRATAELAREIADEPPGPSTPPSAVWAAIAERLQLSDDATPPPSESPAAAAAPPMRARRWLVAAAIVAGLAVAGGAGFALGRHDDTSSSRTVLHADLHILTGGPTGAHGTAVVSRADGRLSVTVSTDGLPLRQGYYQVWLFSPSSTLMVPVGALSGGGSGTFTLPDDIDLRSFDVIDVSAQDAGDNDGQVVHAQSVLQGPLTS